MVRPWTADQKERQIAFSRAVKAWKQAADSTRTNWETWAAANPQYAKHNPSSVLSGFACFTKWHMFEFLDGAGTVDVAPALTVPDAPPITLKIIVAGGVMKISCTTTGSEDWNLSYFLSRPFGASQNFIGTKTRFIVNGTDVTGDLTITTAYTAKFGALPAVGNRIAVDYVRFMESGGQVNSRIQEIITVTAS